MRQSLRLISLILITLMMGCASYQKDSASRTVGEVTDDIGIHTTIKARMVNDELVRGMAINVEVKKGVVGLTGEVRSAEERDRAIEIAESVSGVERVIEKLLIMPR